MRRRFAAGVTAGLAGCTALLWRFPAVRSQRATAVGSEQAMLCRRRPRFLVF
jgi:hypothetical protein